jgi:serine/threonine protein kinase
MGEVYRARDTKLGRDVAIKVLPESVSRDPDRLARFEREARVLASLNHANIAAIHGLEEVPPAQPGGIPVYDDYDIHPDGRTLVLVRRSGRTQAREVTLTANWFTELRRLTAVSSAEGDR